MSGGGLAYLNPGGQQAHKVNALQINISAGRGLQEILKSNLGPRGTMKMLVSGAGMIKITKDGNTLLGEMQIQHPTASLIARAATATDDITGDGSTSTVLIIGEMMRQCERYMQEGLHPRILTEAFDVAKLEAVRFLDASLISTIHMRPGESNREFIYNVARTALSTKVSKGFQNELAKACCDAVLAVQIPGESIDLHMVEIMHMKHRMSNETTFVNGLVLDHGGRNDDMPKVLNDCYIFTCNICLEWERSELSSGFYYSDPAKKAAMAQAERKSTDERVRQIIELKKKVCTKENGKSFVIVNQNGIDPIALEMFSHEGILALRRAKRRNMERLSLACGGEAVNSMENVNEECLGFAKHVHEHTIGDEKFTFIEGVPKGKSCTILIKGQNDHVIAQIKDAIRDGLRSVKNAIEEKGVIAGAGSFEVACQDHLYKYAETLTGKQKLGVRAFADSLLVIPKTLAENSGLDVQSSLILLQEESAKARKSKEWRGLDIETGKTLDPVACGIFDNYSVKKSILQSTGVIASQLLLVDEIMKAGRRGGPAPQQ